jgi:multiple sugar transport system permease protein
MMLARPDIPAWQRPAPAARAFAHAFIWLLAVLILLPFLWMISTSLKGRLEAISDEPTMLPGPWNRPWEWQWGNYADAWAAASLGRFYWNSLIVALITTVLATTHNALAGFAFAKLRFRGRRALFVTLLVTMMLPFQVYFIFAYLICGWLGYIDNYQALIVPFLASAFGIFYMRQAVSNVPDDLLNAGRIDSFSDFELFRYLVLPSIRQGIAALAIFTFMASWNSFFWPLIVIDSNDMFTLPLAVAALAGQMYTDSWPMQMAAATIITAPIVILFLLFQRAFVQGITLTGTKE